MDCKIISHLCRLASVLDTVSIKFYVSSKIFKCNKPDRKGYLISFKPFLFTLVSTMYAIQFLRSKDIAGAEKVINGIFLAVLLCCVSHVQVGRTKTAEMVVLLNALLQFDSIHKDKVVVRRFRSIRDRMNILFVQSIILSVVVVPIGYVYGFHWMQPCKPSIVGYFVIDECHSWPMAKSLFQKTWDKLAKICVFMLNHWMWSYGLHGAAFCTCAFLTITTSRIRSFIETYCHICTNNCSDNIIENFSIYRHIQLLVDLSNEIMQKSLVPVVVVSTTFAMGFSLATTIHTPWVSENMIVLFLMFATYVNSFFFLIFCLGGMATVYQESTMAFDKLEHHCSSISNRNFRKWARHFLRSCNPARMKFGGDNFVEKLTPLNSVGWAINISIQTLLFQRNHETSS